MTYEIKVSIFRSLHLTQANFNEQFPKGIIKIKISSM